MQYVCVCSIRLLSRDGSLLLQNRRGILNTTLLIRLTAHKQSLSMGVLNKNITFNYLGWCKWVDNPNKSVQLFVVKIVLCHWHRMTGEVNAVYLVVPSVYLVVPRRLLQYVSLFGGNSYRIMKNCDDTSNTTAMRKNYNVTHPRWYRKVPRNFTNEILRCGENMQELDYHYEVL